MKKHTFYDGTVTGIAVLSERKIEETFPISDQQSKVTEPQMQGTDKLASADYLYSRHKLEGTKSIRETTAGLAPPRKGTNH